MSKNEYFELVQSLAADLNKDDIKLPEERIPAIMELYQQKLDSLASAVR